MELTAAEAWSRILERAREHLPEQTYRSWLAQTEPVVLSQDHLSIAARDEFAADWIEQKYGDLLCDIAERLFGRRLSIAFQALAVSGPTAPELQLLGEDAPARAGEAGTEPGIPGPAIPGAS